MPFELRPEPHPTPRPDGDYLQQAWQRSVYPIARQMGVPIKLPQVSPRPDQELSVVGNDRASPVVRESLKTRIASLGKPHTHLAFEGFQYAKEHGKANEYNHRVLEAFFVEGHDIGQIAVLSKLAGEVGLDEHGLSEALRSRKYREAHLRALRHAYEAAGVTGVPMFVVGVQVLTGLQDRETLEAVIDEGLVAGERARCPLVGTASAAAKTNV